jgi:hypothetical protein
MADRVSVRIRYRWWLRIDARAGWRQALGMALRHLAHRVDGRYAPAIEIASEPPISAAQRAQIMRCGLQAIERAIEAEVRFDAMDAAMAQLRPGLIEPQI